MCLRVSTRYMEVEERKVQGRRGTAFSGKPLSAFLKRDRPVLCPAGEAFIMHADRLLSVWSLKAAAEALRLRLILDPVQYQVVRFSCLR